MHTVPQVQAYVANLFAKLCYREWFYLLRIEYINIIAMVMQFSFVKH